MVLLSRKNSLPASAWWAAAAASLHHGSNQPDDTAPAHSRLRRTRLGQRRLGLAKWGVRHALRIKLKSC